MGERWATGSDIGLEVLERVQSSLTVGMIMTRRSDLVTCRRNEAIDEVMAHNEDRFSFLPVTDDNGRYLGLFHAEAFFDRDAPSDPIGENFEPFSEGLVIGADASIFDFVRKADERPTRLVVSGHQVSGLISLSDLQKLPVRAALFTVLTSCRVPHDCAVI